MDKNMVSRRSVLQVMVGGLLASSAFADAEPSISGTWTGVLSAGSQRLRLRFDIGKKQGSMVSVDQGGGPIPLEVISLSSEKIEFHIPVIRGSYRGRLIGPDRIEGQWDQGMSIPLTLLRGEAGLRSSNAEAKPLDLDALRELRVHGGAPALIAMVAWKNQPTKIWADGERAIDSHVLVTKDDMWHIGSITKSMTATLVARLVEARKVSWGDTIADILHEKVPTIQPAYLNASFKHLLSHRAGMRKDIPEKEFDQFRRESNGPTRHERLKYASIALNQESLGEIGRTFEYANNSYVVAAAMLEQKMDQDWETLITKYVFEPLNLRSAGFGAPGVKGQLLQPVGHVSKDRPVSQFVGEEAADNPVAIGPAGRVHINLGDLARYLAAHRDQSEFLSSDSWKILHTPPFGGDYAMGWYVRPDQTLWHGGSNALWYAEAMVDKSKGIASAAATNIANGKAAMSAGEALLRASITRS